MWKRGIAGGLACLGLIVAACGDDDAATGPTPGNTNDGGGAKQDGGSSGTVGGDSGGGGTDSGIDEPKIEVCTKPFVVQGPVAELNTDDNESALSLTGDELTGFFERGLQTYQATRASKDQPFANVGSVDVVNNGKARDPFISRDGQTLYFYSDREVFGYNNLWFSKLTNGAFQAPEHVFLTGTTTKMTGSDPFIDERGATAYLIDQNNNFKLMASHVDSLGQWAQFQEVGEINYDGGNAGSFVGQPAISPDGLRLYFVSLQTGAQRIWRSDRASRTATWSAPAALPFTQDGDGVSWVSDDDCRLYFSRAAANGKSDIMLAVRK